MLRRAAFLLFVFCVLAVCVLATRDFAPPVPAASGAFGHGPTIVMIHGLGSTPSHWLPTARLLARDHRVVLIDLPGHGASDMPGDFSLERAALALDAALDDRADEPVVLVGHSVGGLVAAAEALQAPSRVRALVLVETALRPQLEPAEREALLRQFDRDFQGTLKTVYEGFGRDPAQGVALYHEAAAVAPRDLTPWIHLALDSDLSERIAQLRMPLLVVMAPHTWEPGESWSAAAKTLGYARAPFAEPFRINGAGHYVMLDRPGALADAIRRFADRTTIQVDAAASR